MRLAGRILPPPCRGAASWRRMRLNGSVFAADQACSHGQCPPEAKLTLVVSAVSTADYLYLVRRPNQRRSLPGSNKAEELA
jgi:hypothetical protein